MDGAEGPAGADIGDSDGDGMHNGWETAFNAIQMWIPTATALATLPNTRVDESKRRRCDAAAAP